MHKRSSSEVEWALIMEGVVSARLQAHSLHRLINRALAQIEKSEKRDHFYQVAGDLILEIPKQFAQLEMELDATSLALTYLSQDDLKPRLPIYVKDKINDALEAAQVAKKADLAPPLGGGPPSSVEVVTVFWKGEDDPPPPSICHTATYRDNDNLSGYQTYVKHPTDPRVPEKQEVLPSPPWQGHQLQEGPTYINTPDPDRVRYRRKAPIEPQGKDLPSSDVSGINTRKTVTSELLYDRDPDLRYDKTRATPVTHTHDKPFARSPSYNIWNNPGSAKVIPEGHDFQNKKAAVLAAIEELVGDEVRSKSSDVKISMVRVDPAKHIWHFAAQGSKGEEYRIRVKATSINGSISLKKADLKVSCTCPAWVYQGAEHHAMRNDYLYGKLKGSGTTPVMRDPNNRNGTCKHVWAVLSHMKKKNFTLR